MLSTKPSSISLYIAAVISALGIVSQQPTIFTAGAGLATGVGLTTLARPRRNDSEPSEVFRSSADVQVKALNKNLSSFIVREKLQDTQIESLTADVIAVREAIDQLHSQLQIQKTRNNLCIQGIHQAQKDNHGNLAIIAAKDQEILDYKTKIESLNSLVSIQELDKITAKEPTTYLLIDGNAMRFVAQDMGKVDYQALRQVLTQGANKVSAKFYLADVGSYGQKQFITYLEKCGFEVLLFPVVDIGGGQYKTKGDDVNIAIDAVNVSPGDRVILCGGGDADFFPVVNRLKEMGVDFTVVAYLKTTGQALKEAAAGNLVYLETIQSDCLAQYN
jgi:uncharacterized LabA/DUF88 family protein